MIDLSTYQKYYTIASESIYQKYLDPRFSEEITFGYYEKNEWQGIEMSILWERELEDLLPKIECYGDAFVLFTTCHDLFGQIALRGMNLTPGGVCLLLEAAGFTDRTVRKEKPEELVGGREHILSQLACDYRRLALQQYSRKGKAEIDGDFNTAMRYLDTHAQSIGLPVMPQEGDYHQ